jgi:hypothetical protein
MTAAVTGANAIAQAVDIISTAGAVQRAVPPTGGYPDDTA